MPSPLCGELDKARGLAVEEFGGGIVGFRLPEEGADVGTQAPTSTPASGRRRKAS